MKFKIFRLLCLIAYIAIAIVIIYESCLDGKSSSEHSNSVGETVEDVVGEIGGDQALDIQPTEIQITNTKTNGKVGKTVKLMVITLPENSQYTAYSYQSSDNTIATISQTGKIEFLNEGTVTFVVTSITHPTLIDSITYTVTKDKIEDFTVSIDAESVNDIYELYLHNSYKINISTTPDITDYNVCYSSSSESIKIARGIITTNSEVEEATITVTIDDIVKKLEVKVKPLTNPIYTTKLDVNADYISYNNEKSLINLNEAIVLRLNEGIRLNPILDENVNAKSILYTSSDDSILGVSNNGLIIPKSKGTASVTIKEENSSISKTYDIKVVNLIEIDNDNPIKVNGLSLDNGIYKITNGSSGKIALSFIKEASYTKTTYTSANEDVAIVGKDGTIIPKKAGKTTINICCEDDDIKLEYEITVEVKMKTYVSDIPNFFYKIRKGIGHFGAFLVFGIFSTLTYFMWFKPRRWFFTSPINFIQGFLLAGLTEYIQTFVPGRCGSFDDVILDYVGFLSSALIITIAVIIYKIIKLKKNK